MGMQSNQEGVGNNGTSNFALNNLEEPLIANNFYNNPANNLIYQNSVKGWSSYGSQVDNNGALFNSFPSTSVPSAVLNPTMTDAYSLSSSFINQPLPLDFVWTAPPDLYNNINNNFPDQPNLYPTDPHPTSSSTPSHFNLIKREHDNSGLMYGANGTNPALVWNNYQTAMNAASFENYQYKMANFSALKHKDLKPMMVENNPPYRTGPGTNNVRVRTSDKYRMVYSEHQRLELEKDYITNEFITTERKAQLSMDLKLTERQIKIWFQNRRAKDRREKSKLNDMPLH